jgi:hypothetical protein
MLNYVGDLVHNEAKIDTSALVKISAPSSLAGGRGGMSGGSGATGIDSGDGDSFAAIASSTTGAASAADSSAPPPPALELPHQSPSPSLSAARAAAAQTLASQSAWSAPPRILDPAALLDRATIGDDASSSSSSSSFSSSSTNQPQPQPLPLPLELLAVSPSPQRAGAWAAAVADLELSLAGASSGSGSGNIGSTSDSGSSDGGSAIIGGLNAVHQQWDGHVDAFEPIVLHFTRAVVALDSRAAAASSLPAPPAGVRLACDSDAGSNGNGNGGDSGSNGNAGASHPPGAWRWSTAATLRFEPARVWPPALRCRLQLDGAGSDGRGGLAAYDGTRLAALERWPQRGVFEFRSAPLRFVSVGRSGRELSQRATNTSN